MQGKKRAERGGVCGRVFRQDFLGYSAPGVSEQVRLAAEALNESQDFFGNFLLGSLTEPNPFSISGF